MIWPADVLVPLRAVQGARFAPEGTEEGDLCFRYRGCQGRLELRSRDGSRCYCAATMAPCGSCTSMVPECPKCGWRTEEAA